MTRPKPILKIKRNTNFTPSNQLQPAELGVDLGTNKLYIGNSSGVSVPIAAQISSDVTLGGSTPSDNLLATQKASREYILSKISGVAGTLDGKDTFIATRTAYPINSSAILEYIDFSGFTIQQSPTFGLQLSEPLQSGLIQTIKNEMFLNVSYSMHITSIDNNAMVTEGTSLGYWRLSGIRVINTLNPTQVTYYAVQALPPVIGDTSPTINPLPTLLSGNATVRLPRYVSGVSQWELQLIFQVRSVDGSLDIGTGGSNMGINNPIIADGKGIRIQIVKMLESVN